MLDAQPAPAAPDAPIVITARALPDPESERAFAVETFNRSRLADAATAELDQILKEAAGLQLFRRSDARSSHPTSQGVTLRALGGNASSRALLILDGVPQSDPFGGWVNWPAYDPAALAEVRVVRGGGSVGHGPGALAGVIDMTSSVAGGAGGSLEGGSRDSLEARARLGASLAGGRLSLSAHGARGNGFVPITAETRGPVDERAAYRAAGIRGFWLAPLSDGVDAQAGLLAFTDRRDRGVPFTGNRTDGLDASLRLVGRGGWQWSALGYAQWRELASSFASIAGGRASAARASLQDEVPSRALGGSVELRPPAGAGIELRLGADARFTTGESRELFSYVAGEPTRRRVAGGETGTAGLFAEGALKLGPATVSGGARIDRWRVGDGSLREWVIATGDGLRDDSFAARDGWLPTARAGALFDAGGGLSLRAAAYLGWRMPTLNELFRPFRAGADATAANALLEPERLRGAEVGAAVERGGLSASLSLFANRLDDAIANVTLGHGPGQFPGVGFVGAGGEFRQRQNLDAIRVRGAEASAEWRRGAWSLRAGASLTDATVRADGSAAPLDGLRPAQTPRTAFTLAGTWRRSRRAASLTLRHAGGQYEDDLNQRRLPPATTIDAFAAWPVTERLQLVVRGENLLDELVVAGIGGDGAIERATPRTLWLGLRFTAQGVSSSGTP